MMRKNRPREVKEPSYFIFFINISGFHIVRLRTVSTNNLRNIIGKLLTLRVYFPYVLSPLFGF